MDITKEQVIEYLGQLPPMEMAQLVRDLEETWGVSASAPVTTVAPPVEQGPVEEQTEFDVVLESYGEKKIDVIKVLRRVVPGLGLKEAKLMAESVPNPVKEAVSKEEAGEIRAELEAAGATVGVR